MHKSLGSFLVLLLVTPVLATSVSFTDSFEYADGVGDPAYAANWSTIAGANRYPIVERIYNGTTVDPGALDGTKVAMAVTPTPAGGYGISHYLGGPVEPTNDNPLVVKTDWHSMAATTNRFLVSFAMEMSQGDNHVPVLGSAPLAEPIPAIAVAVGAGLDSLDYHFFNGTQWLTTNVRLASGYKQWNWQHLTLSISDLGAPDTQTGKKVTFELINGDGSATGYWTHDLQMPLSVWTEGETFDTFSFRSFPAMTFNSIIDKVDITGGVLVPEPSTLALLCLVLPMIMRRRKA